MGVNTLQNFSGDESGGGGVKYDVERCVRRTGGCEMRWVREGENRV